MGGEAVQAALFGVAHLLPDENDLADDETRAYAGRLRRHWDVMRDDFARQIMDKQAWQLSGCRPINYPPRRIAAMSRLIAGPGASGLGRLALRCFEAGNGPNSSVKRARAIHREVASVFTSASDPYWDARCRFGGQRLATPRKLIGPDRCSILVVNVFVPILLQYARQHGDGALEERVHAVFTHCRKLSPDSVTRFMRRRILGPDEQLRRCINSARRQQGLHQLYQDFCKRDDTDCTQCVLLMALDAWPGAAR